MGVSVLMRGQCGCFSVDEGTVWVFQCYGIEQLVLGKSHRKTKDTLRTMELLMSYVHSSLLAGLSA